MLTFPQICPLLFKFAIAKHYIQTAVTGKLQILAHILLSDQHLSVFDPMSALKIDQWRSAYKALHAGYSFYQNDNLSSNVVLLDG